MALCYLLAFWTGGDQARMDELFRQSGLVREKWDEVHYADGATYGEKTIERVATTTTDFYDPEAGRGSDGQLATSVDGERKPGDLDRTRAYLVEKNKLLTDIIAKLETRLQQKDEEIDRLETLVERSNQSRSA